MSLLRKKNIEANASIVSNVNVEWGNLADGPINDSRRPSEIQFPVPWTSRIQTPVTRPPLGSMWGNEVSESYGGPWG